VRWYGLLIAAAVLVVFGAGPTTPRPVAAASKRRVMPTAADLVARRRTRELAFITWRW